MNRILDNIKKINEKYNITLIVYIFCFLFAPPIIPKINFALVVLVYSFIYIIVKYRNELRNIFHNTDIINALKLVLMYTFVYLLSIIINMLITDKVYLSNYVINAYSLFLFFVTTGICSLYLFFRCKEKNIDINGLIKLIIYAGLIEATLTILSLISPSIKTLLINIMYANTEDKLLNTPWLTSRRFYGFANSMLDLFGFGTGIIATLPIYYFLNKNKQNNTKKIEFKYIVFSIILLMAPFLNSRSGLVVFAIGCIFLLACIIKYKIVSLKEMIKYLAILGVGFAIIVISIFEFSPNTLEWIVKDFKSFVTSSHEEGTADVLFGKEFWTLPQTSNLLIGTGHSVAGYVTKGETNISSDVGYINEIWKVGIIGTIIIYYLIISSLFKAHKYEKSSIYKNMYIFFIVSMLIFSIKGTIFSYNPGWCTICALILFEVLNAKNGRKKNEV